MDAGRRAALEDLARASRLLLGLVVACCALTGPAAGAEPIDAALARYHTLERAGGWQPIPSGPPLAPGMRSPAVAVVRARLASERVQVSAASDPLAYDTPLADAVRSFQRRHGLDGDGVVGDATREAMNVSIETRIAQLERARERAAEPAPRGRWIRINVPAFELQILDGTAVVLEMPVVVGRPSRPTPRYEKTLTSIVVNPDWTVPTDLARLDMLPKIIAEPDYLARRQIDVYESWQPGAPRLDPARIDWKRLGRGIDAFTLRQRPGPGNALGRLMFRMDDEPEIFLHDTPAREVFRLARRDLSSGCIRVADALGLARAVLDAEGRAALTAALSRRETVSVPILAPVPVHIGYETAWVDRRGLVQFRDDLYGEDERIASKVHGARWAPVDLSDALSASSGTGRSPVAPGPSIDRTALEASR